MDDFDALIAKYKQPEDSGDEFDALIARHSGQKPAATSAPSPYAGGLASLGVNVPEKRDIGKELSRRLLQPEIQALDTADGTKIVLPGSAGAAIGLAERMQRDPEFRAAVMPGITERIAARGGAQAGAITEMPDRTIGEFANDNAMLVKQGLKTGLALPLLEAPWNAVDALNASASFYGWPKQPSLPRPQALTELRQRTEAEQSQELSRDGSFALSHYNDNRPEDFLANLGYMIQNPGGATTDFASSVGPMASMLLPGGVQSKVAMQAIQQAGSTAAQVEREVFDKAIQSMPEGEARQLARKKAAESFGQAQIIGMLMPNLVRGGTAVESALAGKVEAQAGRSLAQRAGAAAVATLGEAGSEGGEEGLIQAASNLGTGRPVGEGVGSASAQGIALGGVTGGIAGLAGMRGTELTPEQQRSKMLADLLARTLNPEAVGDVATTMRGDSPRSNEIGPVTVDPITEVLRAAVEAQQQAALTQPPALPVAPRQDAPVPVAGPDAANGATDGSAPEQSILETVGSIVGALGGQDIRPDPAASGPAEVAGIPPGVAAGSDAAAGAQSEGVSRDNPLPNDREGDAPVGSWVAGQRIPGVSPTDTVRQVMEVPIEQIDATEFTSDGNLVLDKKRDADRYAEDIRNGVVLPNARGSELPNGKIKLQDGHRRLAAAVANGATTLRVAVNPMPSNSPTTSPATDQSAAASRPAIAAVEGGLDRQGSSPQVTTLPDGNAADQLPSARAADPLDMRPSREEIAGDNARAAMELGLDADGRPAPEPTFDKPNEADGFKRKFTKRLVPNKKGGYTTLNEPVLDYSHDNLLHFLAANGGVNIGAIAGGFNQGVTHDKRGNPTYKLDFMSDPGNTPFGVKHMPAVRRAGGMNLQQLGEVLREDGWFVDEAGDGNSGQSNQSSYKNDEGDAAKLVVDAISGDPIFHPTEGSGARLEREIASRREDDIAAEERAWNEQEHDKAEVAGVTQRLRDEHGVEISEADGQEAASLADLTSRALDAGVDPASLVRGENEQAGAYAARVWQQIKEAKNGNDNQAVERSDTGGDQVAQGRETATQAEVPSSPRTGLFADATPHEAAQALERRRDDVRNGKSGGKTDTGDGGLLDGQRPEQLDVEDAQPAPPPTPAPATETVAAGNNFTTGIRNEVTDAEREEAGLEQILRNAEISNPEAIARAKAAFAENPDIGRETVSRILDDGLTKRGDGATLLIEKVNVMRAAQAASNRAADPEATPAERAAARKRWDELELQSQEIDEANVAGGTVLGGEFQFRQVMTDAEWTLSSMQSKERAVRGRPLTLEEGATIEKQAAEIDRLQKDLSAALEAADDAALSASLKHAIDSVIAEVGGNKTKPRLERLRDAADKARAAIKATPSVPSKRGQSGAVLPPGLFANYATIGAYHIANGAVKFGDWLSSMKADIGSAVDTYLGSMRDVFRAAGVIEAGSKRKTGEKAKPATVDEALAAIDPENLTHADVYNVVMAHIVTGLRAENEIMAAAHKTLATKMPDLSEREVRRMFSDYGKAKFPSKDEVKRVAAELRQLVQLQESIDRATEGLAPLKSGLQRDKATQAIREKRIRLNDLLKAAERKAVANPELLATYQQTRANNLRNQIEDLTKQRDTGERPKRATPPLPNDEIKALTAKRDAVRAEIRAIDAAGKPQDEPAVKALKAREKALQRRVEDLLQKAAGKPAPDATVQPVSAETIKLDSIIKQLQGELASMKKASKPVVSPEVKARDSRTRDLQRQLGKVRERLRTGDFTKIVRVPKQIDAAHRQITFELNKVKKEFVIRQFEAEMAKRSPLHKIFGAVGEAFNLSRAIMTSFDLSAVGRQGGFIAFGHPIRGAKALAKSIVTLFSEKAAQEAEEQIRQRPNALNGNYKRDKLELTDSNALTLGTAEEAYMARWIDYLPYDGAGETARAALRILRGESTLRDIGRFTRNVATSPLRSSQRAFVTTLNLLRADTYDALTASLAKNGEVVTLEEGRAIANYVNVATGRADIKLAPGGKAITGLNQIFFAPRLVASRLSLLAGGPMYGGTMRTRTLVAGEYARFLISVGIIYALGAAAHDEDDPDRWPAMDMRSADFLKMRFGNVYLDPMTGISQVTTFLAREFAGETTNGKGKVKPLRKQYKVPNLWREVPDYHKPAFGQDDGGDVIARFTRTKLAPIPGAIGNMFTGEDLVGNEVTAESQAKNLLVPMSLRDIGSLMEENGTAQGTTFTMLNLMGVGVQYRKPRNHAKEDTSEKKSTESKDPRL